MNTEETDCQEQIDNLLATAEKLLREQGGWYCCKFIATGLRVHVQYESTASWKIRMGFPYFYVHAMNYDGAERKAEQVQLSLQIICRRAENRGAGFTSTVTEIIERHGCRFYIDQIEGSPKLLRSVRSKRSQTRHTTQKLAASREGLRAKGVQLQDSDSEWARTRTVTKRPKGGYPPTAAKRPVSKGVRPATVGGRPEGGYTPKVTKHETSPPPINGHYSEQEKNTVPFSLCDELARAIINDAYRQEHEPIIPATPQDAPAIKLGHFPLETAYTLCLRIVDRYSVTPYCLNLPPSNGEESMQVVYLEGGVSSRVRKLATAMAKRLLAKG